MAAASDFQSNAASAMVRLPVSVLGAVLWPHGYVQVSSVVQLPSVIGCNTIYVYSMAVR